MTTLTKTFAAWFDEVKTSISGWFFPGVLIPAVEQVPQKKPKTTDQSHYFPFESVTYVKTKP